MATTDLTEATFGPAIETNEMVVIDFWAAWCGPCRAFAPTFAAASEEHTDVFFGKVDTESQRGIAAHFKIQSIPTLMVFREQVLLYAKPGALPAAALDELIGKVKAIDMADVHAKIAQERAKEGTAEA